MIVRYISARDRLNYGDFLFSLIFKEYFKDTFDIEFYGIVESNYSYFGAIPTQSYKTWCSEFYEPSIDYEELSTKAKTVFQKWDKTKAQLQLEYCQKLVENYFFDIQKYLKVKRNYKSI